MQPFDLSFERLNDGWNAEPNAPAPKVHVPPSRPTRCLTAHRLNQFWKIAGYAAHGALTSAIRRSRPESGGTAMCREGPEAEVGTPTANKTAYLQSNPRLNSPREPENSATARRIFDRMLDQLEADAG